MGTTTFSGPIRAGTIKSTTGTTLGTDINNVGEVSRAHLADPVFVGVVRLHNSFLAVDLGVLGVAV